MISSCGFTASRRLARCDLWSTLGFTASRRSTRQKIVAARTTELANAVELARDFPNRIASRGHRTRRGGARLPKEHSWQGPSRTTQKIVAAKGHEYQHRQVGRWVRSKAKSTTAVTSSRHDIHALEEADEGEDGDGAEERTRCISIINEGCAHHLIDVEGRSHARRTPYR